MGELFYNISTVIMESSLLMTLVTTFIVVMIINAVRGKNKKKTQQTDAPLMQQNVQRPAQRPVYSTPQPQPVSGVQSPRFGSLAEAAEYLLRCEATLQTRIEFFLLESYVKSMGTQKLFDDIANIISGIWTLALNTGASRPDGYVPVKLGITYRPGIVIIDKLRKNSVSSLTPDEQKLYSIAAQIVSDCRKRAHSSLELEKLLHDTLSDNVAYFNTNDIHHRNRIVSAYGALIDGTANCQGFSDAFYLLASLAGFNAAIVCGNSIRGPHAWNAIEVDGTWYYTDVTFNQIEDVKDMDDSVGYSMFNVANDRAARIYELHDYHRKLPIAPHTALQHDFYRCGLPGFGISADSLADAGRALIDHFNRNNDVTYLRINEIHADVNVLSEHIQTYARGNTGLKAWNILCSTSLNDTYAVVFWKRA